MLQARPRFERFPSEAIRELAKSRTVMQMNMKDIALSLSSPGSDPVLLYMGVKSTEKSGKPSKEVTDLGYALFKGGRMIGTLEKNNALGLAWLRDEASDATVTVDVGENRYVTARVSGSGSDIRVRPRNGKLEYEIRFNADATLLESTGSYDLSQTSNIRMVENALSELVRSTVQETIDAMKKHRTDPAQLGMYLRRTYPKLWAEMYASDWPNGIREADFQINAAVTLSETGLIYRNVAEETKQP